MSVYTTVDAAELTAFLTRFDIGELVAHEGISEGIENTNYFVYTTRGSYVMTLFEATAFDGLPFFLDLMAYLAENGLPVAHPLPDRDGRYLSELKDRPAAIVMRLEGRSVEAPNPAQCEAIGDAMARMHFIGTGFEQRRGDDRGLAWRRQAAARVLPHLPRALAQDLERELALSERVAQVALPSGVIHADLFRDNALFVDDTLTGLIDFYYAFTGPFLYDLAVLMNDWCTVPGSPGLDEARARTIAGAYQAVRRVSDEERAAWPEMLRHAASRFWLSRLVDQIFPREGELTTVKDPAVYHAIICERRAIGDALRDVWN